MFSPISALQDSLAEMFGVAADHREQLVADMVERHARDRVSYWLQLSLAIGIATLGLVLGSTGVVIGAMLISPLMSPLVELGMGLAIGSPVLFARSFIRTFFSVVVCVGGAALITLSLPFHQTTSEIAARTSPTALDLLVAAFCALAAAYTTVKLTSDTTTAAAGTAIGIALVPPLCVGGFGLGSGSLTTAAGALLLFTANFGAIVLVSVFAFLALGFDRVRVHELERRAIASGVITTSVGRWAHALFGARYGRALRLALPVLMLAAVYVPLRRALQEVSWEVRTRAAIEQVLRQLPAADAAIRASTVVDRHAVSVRLAIVSSASDAAKLEAELKRRVQQIAGVEPSVEVLALPDLATLQQVAEPQLSAPPAPRLTTLGSLPRLEETLRALWPEPTAGPLLAWHVTERGGVKRLAVHHLGPPLGESAIHLLESMLTERIDAALLVEDRAYARDGAAAPEANEAVLVALAEAIAAAEAVPELRVCVAAPAELPAASEADRAPDQAQPSPSAHAAAVRALIRRHPERVELREAGEWRVGLAIQCPVAAPAPSMAGAAVPPSAATSMPPATPSPAPR